MVHDSPKVENRWNRGVDDEFPKKLYAKLQLGQSIIRFQLDCGATVNLISLSTLHQALGTECTLRPPETDLRMFDNTQLKTVGMITAKIENPKTNECHVMDFFCYGKPPSINSRLASLPTATVTHGQQREHSGFMWNTHNKGEHFRRIQRSLHWIRETSRYPTH